MNKKVDGRDFNHSNGPVRPSKSFSIGELAKEFGISTRAIRFYEEKGLLNPNRSRAARLYNHKDRARLILILRGKRLGFTLEQITELMELYRRDTTQVKQLRYFLSLADQMRKKFEQQLADLTLSLEELDEIEVLCRTELEQKSAKT